MTDERRNRVRDAAKQSWAEPWKIKMVEMTRWTSREYRVERMAEAGYNTFLLRSDDVYIDLLTDSGTSAMSSDQWSGLVATAESESGTDGYDRFVETLREITGYRHILPVHQGRAAEHLLSQTVIRPGQYVVNNMYFT